MDGLDQPSTAGAPAALPGGGRTIRQHAPRRRGRAATSWGVPVLRRMELHTCATLTAALPQVVWVRPALVFFILSSRARVQRDPDW